MKKIISLSICLLSLVSYSQQTPQRNLYGYNKYAINPAYSGASGCTQINFSHLNQWVKVEGAPLTSMISANGLIGKSLGVGGQVLVDQIGMIQQVSAMGSLSYGLTIGKTHNIRLGASVGYNQYRIDATNAIAFENGDPIIEGGEQAGGTLNSNIGILYQWKNLEISIGSQQLIQSTSNMSFSGIDGFGLRRHLNGLVAYNQKIGDNWMLTPSIYTKGTNNGYQLDLNADATYKKYISGGLGYRTSVGLIARAGIQVQDLFFIGYAYETPMSNIASYSSGSHEILLGIKFCKKKPKTIPEIAETNKEAQDTTNNALRNEQITELPAMDTIVITRVDTVYIEAAIEEIAEVKQAEAEKKDFIPIEKNVLFEFDKAVVQKGSFGALESIVNILNAKSELKISLKGHTDAQGPENYNVMLSENRVSAVQDFLLANGISADRIIIEAFGEKVPIADNSSSEGRKLNRRVEVRFIEK
ncbi:MAG: PorP/SprF family type IX secretion system membrane protein [Crocinitomicaceae bacterium]|nr:PorP/SprF family type IX secretion system membrane protein [Crocinitomicaceae bacterium]